MRIGAVDMGTNSSRLLIVDYGDKNFNTIKRELITTRIGEGVDKDGCLREGAVERALDAIREFKLIMDNYGVEKRQAVGTSALREVNNSEEFLARVRAELDEEIKIISGQEEAELTYLGVSLDYPRENLLIIDIGGGSTELITRINGEIKYVSLPLGAVRLTERYISDPNRPMMESDYHKIVSSINDKLVEEAFSIKTGQFTGIGVGGTITTLAAMDLELTEYDRDRIHNHNLSAKKIKSLFESLASLMIDERKKLKGLQAERADIITAGTVILMQVMSKFKLNEISVSEHDLLFGIARRLSAGP